MHLASILPTTLLIELDLLASDEGFLQGTADAHRVDRTFKLHRRRRVV